MRRARCAAWSAALLLGVASCSHTPRTSTPAQAPPPTYHRATGRPPASSALPSVPPSAASSPAPSASAATPAAPLSASGPPVVKNVPRLAPNAAPQILSVAVSETTVAPGDKVSGSVVTSSNVASVEARIGGYAVHLAKTGVGRFALTYRVAPLPWFVRGNFTLKVIARNPRGDKATRAIPITVK